jgi:hypothetical protein
MFAAHGVTQETALVGEILIGVGDFGEEDVLVLEGDDVPGARDPQPQLVAVALELAHGEDVEQLRMERFAVQLKHQVRHARSDEKRIHDITSNSFCPRL